VRPSTLIRSVRRGSRKGYNNLFRIVRCTTVICLFVVEMTLWTEDNRTAYAAPIDSCREPFVFTQLPINLLAVEYTSRTIGTPSQSHPDRDLALETTAQQLAWLVKLDAALSAIYSGLGIVGAYANGDPQACAPDQLLASLAERKQDLGRSGQALLILYGRIYQEDDNVYLQSYLRRVRFGQNTSEMAADRLAVTLNDVSFSATIPGETIVFPPRQLSVSELKEATELFKDSSRIYEKKDIASSSVPLNPENFSIAATEEIDPTGWVKIRTGSNGSSEGWVRMDQEKASFLRRRLPELDFLNGEIGYLLAREAFDSRESRFLQSRSSLMDAMRLGFEQYTKGEVENVRPEVRAATLSMEGSVLALDTEDAKTSRWNEVREVFREAVEVDPSSTEARNLVAMADIAELPQQSEPKIVEDVLLDVLSLRPDDTDALANMENFYRYLLNHVGSDGGKYSVAELQGKQEQANAVRVALGYAEPLLAGAKSTILVSVPELSSPYFQRMMTAFIAEAKTQGLDVIKGDGHASPPRQTADIEAGIAKGVSGIVLTPSDFDAPALQEAVDAKVPVVTVGRRVPSVKGILAHVGSDDVKGGEEQGNLITKLFADGATILNLRGKPGTRAAIDRDEGLHHILEKGWWQVQDCFRTDRWLGPRQVHFGH
jgi:hypothetical protein